MGGGGDFFLQQKENVRARYFLLRSCAAVMIACTEPHLYVELQALNGLLSGKRGESCFLKVALYQQKLLYINDCMAAVNQVNDQGVLLVLGL